MKPMNCTNMFAKTKLPTTNRIESHPNSVQGDLFGLVSAIYSVRNMDGMINALMDITHDTSDAGQFPTSTNNEGDLEPGDSP